MKLSNNNDKQHQQQQQTQEEEMKTTIATAIAKAVVRDVMDKKRTLLSQSADGGGRSSFPVIPATPTSTTIVAATATTTITTIVDLNDLASSLSLDPSLSSTIDDYPIQQHHQSSVKDNNEEEGITVPLPDTLDDTVASPVDVEEEEEDVSDNINIDLKETSAATKSIVMNEMAVTATTTNSTPKKRRRKEVYSVKLPTFESIELASRLSAFDSFLFLVNDQQQQVTDSCSTTSLTCGKVSDLATIGTKNRQGEGHNDQYSVENNVQDRNAATITTKKNEETIAMDTRLFIDSLIQQNIESHSLPTVLINPGMEIIIEERQKKRIIPLEERTVRLIPGSIEEKNDLMDRLSVFDDYLFLLS
jgi:hypothetical protein